MKKAPSTAKPRRRTAAPKTKAPPRRILVADDSVEILEVVRLLLEPKGYKIITTQKNVLSTVKKEHPDLLLLDVLMSGEDGCLITKKLKASKTLRDIPIVLFSAKNDLAWIAAEAGADGFLGKPFTSGSLYKVVDRLAKKTMGGS